MFFLGVDLGTSYFKAGVFDADGKLLGLGRLALPKVSSAKVSEVSHAEFLSALRSSVDVAIKYAGIKHDEIVSISYGSQANSFILLDKNGNELIPFVLWNDNQATMDASVGTFMHQNSFKTITGIGIEPSPQFLVNKLKWWRRGYQELFNEVAYVLTMPDYLCLKLTGQRIVDTSTASLTGLLDFTSNDWCDDALRVAEIETANLSKPFSIATHCGNVAANDNFLGLKKGTFFCAGGLDHHVAAIGAGVGKLFDVSESTGTVIAAIEHSDNGQVLKDVCVAAGLSPSRFFRMSFNENGAVALEWYQKNYASEYSFDQLAQMAEETPDNNDLIALPFVNRFDGLSGFQNVKEHYHHGHYVRAIMKSTAESLRELFQQLQVKQDSRIVSTGGGAKSKLWRNIKSSVSGKELSVPLNAEAACLGAAMVAATGYGAFKSVYEAQEAWLSKNI